MKILPSLLLVATVIFSTVIQAKHKGVFNKIFSSKNSTNSPVKKNSYPVPSKSIKEMTEEELLLVLDYAKNNKDKELIFKVYSHLLSVCQDHTKLKTYKLEIADYCFGLQDYEKASLGYEEFCILYPSCNEAEYAEYKLILCTFLTSLEAHRDQTDTNRTINFITHFLQKAKDPKFITEAESIFKTCRKRLLEHEVIVFEIYLKQQKFTAAQQRIEFMDQNFKDIEKIEKYIEYVQKIYASVKDPATRPFYFSIKLEDALKQEKETSKNKITKKDIEKTVSFFVA